MQADAGQMQGTNGPCHIVALNCLSNPGQAEDLDLCPDPGSTPLGLCVNLCFRRWRHRPNFERFNGRFRSCV